MFTPEARHSGTDRPGRRPSLVCAGWLREELRKTRLADLLDPVTTESPHLQCAHARALVRIAGKFRLQATRARRSKCDPVGHCRIRPNALDCAQFGSITATQEAKP